MRLIRKIFNVFLFFIAKLYSKLIGYKYEEPLNKYDLLFIKQDTINVGVMYRQQNSNSLNNINALMNEIKKTNIWYQQNYEEQHIFSVKIKNKDKYILNQCHRKIYGVDIFTFTDEEKREIKNQERKKKLQKLTCQYLSLNHQ